MYTFKKDNVIAVMESMPEYFTIDELVDQLNFVKGIDQGLKDSEEGKVYTEEEVRTKLSKWLK